MPLVVVRYLPALPVIDGMKPAAVVALASADDADVAADEADVAAEAALVAAAVAEVAALVADVFA